MEEKMEKEKGLKQMLIEMSVGDTVHFPIRRLSVVRSTCSTLGCELERKYMTRMIKPGKKQVAVLRMA